MWKADMRILIADDHDMVRRGVIAIVESHVGLKICGEASDGTDAIPKWARLILLRHAADIVRQCPLAGRPDLELPKAASAASIRSTSRCARSRSFLKRWTTPDKFPITSPSA